MKNNITLTFLLWLLFPNGSLSFHQPAAFHAGRGAPKTTTSSTQRHAFSVGAVDAFFETQPYIAAFLTCSFKASAADALAQTTSASSQDDDMNSRVSHLKSIEDSENKEAAQLDFVRNLAFVIYGGFYQGMAQTFLYSHLYPLLFGTEPTVQSVLAQASMENFLLAPLVCLPTVYTIKGLLEGKTITSGLEKYWDHIFSQQILIKYWSLWFPVACFNFSVVPEHLRVPFGACVSFFWVCILSSISARDAASTTTPQEEDFPKSSPLLQQQQRPGSNVLSTISPATSTVR